MQPTYSPLLSAIYSAIRSPFDPRRSGASWTPLTLFLAGEQGGWYDPSDVDRYMDVSQSPELVTNGDASSTAGWTAANGAVTISAGAFLYTKNAVGGAGILVTGIATVPGRSYFITAAHVANSGGLQMFVGASNNADGSSAFASGPGEFPVGRTATSFFTATATTTYVFTRVNTMSPGGTYAVDNISVKEVTGISTATMFQDSAGTTPVTAVEQPVGLWLDKRLGALSALGPELVTNGTFDAGTDGWTGNNSTLSVSSSALIVTSTSTNNIYAGQTVPVTPTKTYRYSARIFAPSANVGVNVARAFLYTNSSLGVPIIFSASNAASSEDAWLEVVAFFTATTSSVFVQLGVGSSVAWGANGDTARFDNVSIREVPGNHLIQPTSASRPTYSKRYNLLQRTDDFANAAWLKQQSTISGLQLQEDSTAAALHRTVQTISGLPSDTSYTLTAWVAAGTRTFAQVSMSDNATGSAGCNIDLTTGATSNVLSGSWTSLILSVAAETVSGIAGWRVTVAATKGAGADVVAQINIATALGTVSYNGGGSSQFIYASRADLRRTIHTTMGMPAYQRVTTATDYDETGFLPRLRFYGADDSMYSAASVDFTATDEMTVLAGLTKLSDAASGVVVELSDDFSLRTGSMGLLAPSSSGANSYRYASQIAAAPVGTGVFAAAPNTSVITALSDISAPINTLRRNGAVQETSKATQGAGNYGNWVLFVGRRNNASLPLNGDIFQLIVRGALTSGATLTSAEQYVAQRTGVTL